MLFNGVFELRKIKPCLFLNHCSIKFIYDALHLLMGGSYIFVKVYCYHSKPNLVQYGKIKLLPENAVDIKETDFNIEEIDEPLLPMKKKHFWHFITRYFCKPPPPIDKTMLALHISVMSYIHKIPPDKIPSSHTFVDSEMQNKVLNK